MAGGKLPTVSTAIIIHLIEKIMASFFYEYFKAARRAKMLIAVL
jgi:hypothetical protein